MWGRKSLRDVVALGGVGDDSDCPGGLVLEFLVGKFPLGSYYEYPILCNIAVLAKYCRLWLSQFWDGP